MRLTLSICLLLTVSACGKFEVERVTPATRNHLGFTFNERPMNLVWSGKTNHVVPRTASKVFSNRDVAGIATITYGSGPALTPDDAAVIVSSLIGCQRAASAPGFGNDGARRTISIPIHCTP